ncbi:transcription termination factor MTERF2, chloroplastic [Durio zibethinus]|uniref:Transcription termination factor MTERF2, chloroplastic n=1 Tax=Durio zibethinus TaxID=66656 RepID=A0A6P5X564_DURZI|nr:transcription termination factor MTERF2, chloroplastic [Durio zibethinus]XP_022723566.1 transcription termination factor MTERF2, chloroplastic [Durio zibethinus]
MSTKSFSIHWNFKSLFPNTCFLQFPRRCSANALPLSFSHYQRIHSPKPYLPQPPLAQPNPSNQTPRDITQAQESVSEYLQELGISFEESISIASNSPKYTQMLVDGVKELEEWNAWNNNIEGENLGFKEMVIYMAKEKGDNGKVAFLESAGLSLASAMGVARYLSSESLPSLIHKVKYMKEIIFSSSDDKGLSGKNARRMMMHLSIASDEDVQQTLSFFEKIEARRGGIDMLGSVDASLRYLLESFPRLLLLPVESHLKPIVEFLENIGVPRRSMGKVFLLFPPVLFYKIQGIKTKVLAFEKVGATYEDVRKMLLKYPWILSTSIQKNYEQILLLFEEEKIPKASVDRAIRSWPHLLGCSTSKLKLMVDQFGELGVRNKKLGRVIAKSPQLLLRKPQELLQVVLFLEGLGFDRENVGKLLARCPEIFAANVDKTLKKKVEFPAQLGISNDHLPQVIKKYPELFVSDVDKTLRPRIKYLMEIGLSKREIALMVRRFSPLLGYSIEEVLRPKLQFLLDTMGKPVKDVVDYPRFFSYSLEKKIKPRFWVLKGRNIECSLKDMLGKNNEEFAAEFMGVGRRLDSPSSHQ